MFQFGGAVRRVPEEATAFTGRTAGFAVNVNAVALPEDAAEQAAWARGLGRALRPLSAGVYMNFLDDEGQERVRAAYGPAKYQRLAASKRSGTPTTSSAATRTSAPAPDGLPQGRTRVFGDQGYAYG